MANRKTFSEHFGLGKSQHELDFVDVPINGDIPLFLDPFAISQQPDEWSRDCHLLLHAYFQQIIDQIRAGHSDDARRLLTHLQEPNETRLGLSRQKPQGAGLGEIQSEQVFQALAQSSAVKTGFLNSLEECELMVPGIGKDKISDLTTNILRAPLVQYTQDQCALHGVPTTPSPLPPFYDIRRHQWVTAYFELPRAGVGPVLLVPKAIVRYKPAYRRDKYYRHFVLEFLRDEHLRANSSLVHTFKNRRRTVFKKVLEEEVLSNTKENLFQFSRDNPEVLQDYRAALERLESQGHTDAISPEDEQLIAEALATAVSSIPGGHSAATEYHRLMTGVVEFLFFPQLMYPVKEQEIHEGRKRIDIVMENAARAGIFNRLHAVRGIPCSKIMIECKNYTREIANPELDQISGRFSPNRGKVGLICCRAFEDRGHFVARCRDTFRDDRGLVLPLDDETILEWLELVAAGERGKLERELTDLVDEVWM